MNKFLLSVLFSILVINNTNAVVYNSEPKIFITELVADALKVLEDKSISKEDKAKQIEKIALENVDIKALGMYTLGDLRKNLDNSSLSKYNELFEKYFLKSLTSRLTDYSSSKFEVLSADKKSVNYTIVESRIAESSNQPEIKINWRVYTKDPLKPLIRDLIVEGLSLARTQKEEFSSIINSNDGKIEALLKNLTDFTSK